MKHQELRYLGKVENKKGTKLSDRRRLGTLWQKHSRETEEWRLIITKGAELGLKRTTKPREKTNTVGRDLHLNVLKTEHKNKHTKH